MLLILSTGCKLHPFRVGNGSTEEIEHRFERTSFPVKQEERRSSLVTVRFDGVSFRSAMRTLTDQTGVAIAWEQRLDEEPVMGSFINQSLAAVLDVISRRFSVSVTEISGVYFIGEFKRSDMVTAVVTVPPVDRGELERALSSVCTENGHSSIVGSFVWISDTLETVRKIVSDIEEIRTRSERSYLAEVYFVRVNEKDFVRLTGDLRFKSVDVFSSAFNVEELFEMFLDADAGLGSSSVDARPVLTLSEGRKAVFEVGSEIVRERKAVNERGIMETTGYETFNDGIDLTLMLNRVSDERYSLDLSLSVSTFDQSGKTDTGVPVKNKSVLKSPGLLVRDGGVVYAGSLKRKDGNKVFGLFSVDGLRSSDVLTIWVRVREVR